MKLKYIDKETIDIEGLKYNCIMVNSTAEVKLLSELKVGTQEITALEYSEYKHYAFNKTKIYNAIKILGKNFYNQIIEFYKEQQLNSQGDTQGMIEIYSKAIMNMAIYANRGKTYEYIREWLKDYPFPYEIKTDTRYSPEEKYCYCSIQDLIVDATLIYYIDKLIHYKRANLSISSILKRIYIFYSNDLEKSFEQYEENSKKEDGALEKLIIEIISYRKEKQNLYIYNKPYFINNYNNNIQVYLEATNIMAIAYNEMELKLSTIEEETTGKKCALPNCNHYFFPTGRQNRKEYCSEECRKIANRIKSNRCYAKNHKKKSTHYNTHY